jgi:eukaryotic-like serine/threonine-protein kinase
MQQHTDHGDVPAPDRRRREIAGRTGSSELSDPPVAAPGEAHQSARRPGLWQEVRQRRLFQILASYAALGWVTMEVIESLVGREVLPDILYTVGMTWYLAGFGATAVIGWFHGEKGDQKAPKPELAFLGLLLVSVLTLNAFSISDYRAERLALLAAAEGTLDPHRIAVLYFEDMGSDADELYLADAVTEELIAELSEVRALDVVSRNGVAPFRASPLAPDSLARLLRAGTVVSGSIQRRGNRMRVDLQLIDGASGAPVQRGSLEHPADDLQGLGAAVAERASAVLREWLGDEVRLRTTKRATESLPAWSQYQRAEKRRKDAAAYFARGDMSAAMAALDEADDLASRAELLDVNWAAPSTLRAEVAFMRAVRENDAATPWITAALDHAERALQRSPRDPRALEMRGTIHYRRYHRPGALDADARAALLNSARADLEEAVRLDPTRASAFVTLSNLYYDFADISSAVLAGRRAYEEDAYLDNANVVLDRLFWGSVDLQQFGEATRWCQEGGRRFPDDFRFSMCPLVLMAAPATQPEVDRAWELVAAVDSLAPPARRDFYRVRAAIFTAAAIARAALPDSARSVLTRLEQEIPQVDPAQGLFAASAYPYILLSDYDRAIDNYKRYLLVNPQHALKPDREIGWWWNPLRSHPRFAELLARP